MLGDFSYDKVDYFLGERNWEVLSNENYRYQGETKKKGVFEIEKTKHGKGILILKTGECFEGTFKDGKKTGKGRLIYADGHIYIGYFRDDLKEGT